MLSAAMNQKNMTYNGCTAQSQNFTRHRLTTNRAQLAALRLARVFLFFSNAAQL